MHYPDASLPRLLAVLLFLAPIAGKAYGKGPAGPSFQADSSPFPLLEQAPAAMGDQTWTRVMQSGGGLLGGLSLGFLGILGGAALVSCPEDRDADDFSCGIAKGGMGILVGSGGYVLGTSLGIHIVGRLKDRHGWYTAALGGAIGGFAAGALSASYTDMRLRPALALTLGASNLASLGLYSMTDRFDARLGFTAPSTRSATPSGTLAASSLRAEARFIMLRH